MQNTGATLGNRQPDRATTGAKQSNIPISPPKQQTRKPVSIQMVVGIVVLVVALALLVMRFQFFTGNNGNPQTAGTASAFTDTFTNNNAGWIIGNINGLTASINGGHYTLDAGPKNTYFPYSTKIGTLPSDFTLMAQIQQNKGDTNIAYGIVFYLNSAAKSCYAFFITSSGGYEILRYDATGSASPLWQGNSAQIHAHQSNILQVTAHHGTFSFKVNDQVLSLNGGKTSITDTTYSSGYLGLLVAGPNAEFTATKVQLTLP